MSMCACACVAVPKLGHGLSRREAACVKHKALRSAFLLKSRVARAHVHSASLNVRGKNVDFLKDVNSLFFFLFYYYYFF